MGLSILVRSDPHTLLAPACAQPGPRAERETAFYEEMERLRSSAEASTSAPDGADDGDVMQQLAAFIPRSCA